MLPSGGLGVCGSRFRLLHVFVTAHRCHGTVMAPQFSGSKPTYSNAANLHSIIVLPQHAFNFWSLASVDLIYCHIRHLPKCAHHREAVTKRSEAGISNRTA